MATKTAVIVLCEEAVLIWAIPPLLPGPPDFFDHNPPHVPPPLFAIPFPYKIPLHPDRTCWKTISSWYFGSSHPLYFGILCEEIDLHRFQIMLKSDLSTASLHVIHTSELTPVSFQNCKILGYTPVSFHCYYDEAYQSGIYTGLTSARIADIISHCGPDIGRDYRLFSCPASGKFVLLNSYHSVFVLDLF